MATSKRPPADEAQQPAPEGSAVPAATTQQAAAEAAPTAAATGDTQRDGDAGRFAPYPGAGFFHAGRYHPLFRAMGRRLIAEDCGRYLSTPGPEWTREHARSYAVWQERQGAEPTGVPDAESWAALRVPKA